MSIAGRVCCLIGLSGIFACSLAEIPGDGSFQENSISAQSCTTEPVKLPTIDERELASLSTCACRAGGKAHCVPTAKLPEKLAKPLAECEDASGRCVPDAILERGGEPFPKCRTSGDEGRCVSLCVPKVAKYVEALTRGDGDTCGSDERCVPCKMPDGASSGICEVGATTCAAPPSPPSGALSCPFTGTKMNVAQMPVCAPGGRCVSDSLLETVIADPNTRSELQARLATCGDGYCVPEDYLKNYGQYKPPACRSFAGIEGRCFSTVFKDVAAQKELLSRDTCGELDRCIPCFNPADGSPSGACTTVTCDAPKTPPKALDNCCSQGGAMRGKCVPRGDVPERFRDRLTTHECDSEAELCMPTENVDLKSTPAKCVPSTAYGGLNPAGMEGACVSRCLVFGFLERFVFQRTSCREDQICAPCTDPQTGAPTGVPGCQAPAPR